MRLHLHWLPVVLLAFFIGCAGNSETKNTSGSKSGEGSKSTAGADSSKEKGSSNEKEGDVSGTKSSGKKKKVAFVTNQIASFWNIAEVGAKDAGNDLGVDVEVRFPATATAAKQKQIVEDLLSAGIDGLAVSPIDADNQRDMMNEWCGKLPTITHDSDAPGTERLMYIGMDNYRAGRLVGKLIRRHYPDGAKMVLTIGRLEQENAKKRRQGVIDELLERTEDATRFDPVEGEISGDKYTIYATLLDQGESTVAKQKAEDALNKYNDIDLFVGLFAYNPPACLQAIKQANKLEDVRVAGFDEDDLTLQGIKDGTVIGTVVQNPYEYGYQSVRILSELLKGNQSVIPESKFIDIEARMVTKSGETIDGIESENVDDFWTALKDLIGE